MHERRNTPKRFPKEGARPFLFEAPHLVIFPAIAVMLCVLSFNFLGDALRDYLDPRTRIAVGL